MDEALESLLVVEWMMALLESATPAQRLVAETCRREAIAPGRLALHSDRGSSKLVALVLSTLGVTKPRSRPQVSNDAPFSEIQVETLEDRPAVPDGFGAPERFAGGPPRSAPLRIGENGRCCIE